MPIKVGDRLPEAKFRVMTTEGPVWKITDEVFEVADRKWRGIGTIPLSGLRLRPEFATHDAEKVFGLEGFEAQEPPECISALVLQGLKKPVDCPVFGKTCTPEKPLGALMVSAEGACSAYYQYRRTM